MAESNDQEESAWSWNSWINAAKNKSTEVLEFVKKDLEEFGAAVKTEASNMMTSTSGVLEKTLKLNDSESTAGTMKRTFSSFLGQMNTVLNPSPDDSETEAVVISQDNETVPLTKLQLALLELQKNTGTFLKDPEQNLAAQYECWLEIISDQLTEERLAKHLMSSETLNQQYLTLCPDQVLHEIFWKRYLFKKALLEDNMAHQEAMEKREHREKQMTEENLKWEQEDFASNIDLTEEEQTKLLEQYEKEFKVKRSFRRNSKSAPKDLTEETYVAPPEVVVAAAAANTDGATVVAERNTAADSEKVVGVSDSPVKTPSDTSLNSAETKSSTSSLDGEWECVASEKI